MFGGTCAGRAVSLRERTRTREKAGCYTQPASPVVELRTYWMGVTVADTVKGSVGAAAPAAATFCQIAPAWLLANARLPVEAGLVGIAVV